MRRSFERLAALAFLVLVVVGCSTSQPATPRPTPKSPYTNPPPTPTLSAIATVAPTGHGHPYTHADCSALLADWIATHPVAIDPTLQAPPVMKAIANVLADDIQTYDGQPYREVFFGGRCDEPPVRCDLTLTGVPSFVADRAAGDSYTWEILPRTPLVTLTDAGRAGFPPDLTDALDALARSLDTGGQIGDRTLDSAQWAPAPPDDAYLLRYSHGLEEGDPPVWVRLDRGGRRILSIGAQP